MKKVIAILLVVLVEGVMFGDGLGESADLTLQSTVAAKTVHGFGASAYSSFGDIVSASANLGDSSYTGLDLESDSSQNVGYYAFASSLISGVQVTFTANPLTFTSGSDTYYVPYTLTYTKGAGTVGSTGTIALSGNVGTAAISAGSADLLTTANNPTGPKWASYSLAVAFDGSSNFSYGLPVGTYSGTVVAAVTAP